MASDDHVIVLGGDGLAPPDPVPPRRPPVALLLLVVALLVGVIAFVLSPQTETPTVADPTGLEAPPEPPRAFVESTAVTAPADVPQLALGWKPVAMVGFAFVSDIAHGPSGWLAASAGFPVVVHTSPNAVLWEAASLVDVTGSDPQVAVGNGGMVVAAVGVLDNAVFAAVSRDGGETWGESLVDGRPAVVHGAAVIGSVAHVFGELIDRDDPVPGEGAPVVWRHDDQGWVAIEDPGASDGAVTGVLQAGDGSVRGFGRRDGIAAAWALGDTLEPVAVDVPPALASFVEVGSDGGAGYFAVGGSIETGTGNAIWWSQDLTSWEASGSGSPLREAIVHDGQVVGVHGEVGLVAVGMDAQSFISNRYPGAETGWEEFGYVAALATDGKTVVLGGSDDAGRPAMAVRGITVQPTSLPVVADVTWSPVAVAVVAAAERDVGYPVVVTLDDATFALAAGQVWQVQGVETPHPEIAPVMVEGDPLRARKLGRVGDGMWVFDADDGRLLTRDVDGRWTSAVVPLQWVEGVLEADGALVAVGYGEASAAAVARLEPDGDWVLADGADPAVSPVAAAGGAVFGVRDDGSGTVTQVVSTDGVRWEPSGFDGHADLVLRGFAGLPFLRDRSEPTTVWLLDRWPEVEEVALPTSSSPWVIQRIEDQLWVSGPGALWIRGADMTWTQLPTGVQHGVTGTPAVIPGEVPTLVVSVDGRVELLRLVD